MPRHLRKLLCRFLLLTLGPFYGHVKIARNQKTDHALLLLQGVRFYDHLQCQTRDKR